jgi:hypothetical protein
MNVARHNPYFTLEIEQLVKNDMWKKMKECVMEVKLTYCIH